MTAEITPDTNVLSVREAAKVMRCSEWTVRKMLHDDQAFAEAVVIHVGTWTRISRVKLERWLHGERVSA